MDIKSFGVICRLCMCTGTDFIDIFNGKVSNLIIAEVIVECAPVTVRSDDGLPDLICKTCLYRLEMTRQFREQCSLSDSALRSFIKESYQQINSVESMDLMNDQVYEMSDSKSDEFMEMPVKVELSESEEEFQPVLLTDEELHQCYIQEEILEKEKNIKLGENEMEDIDHLFACGICSRTFSVLSKLIVHQRVHRSENKNSVHNTIECDMCPDEFKTIGSLEKHIKLVHYNGSTYKCKSCDRTFDVREDLIEHAKEHSNEAQLFNCKKCKKEFFGEEAVDHKCKPKKKALKCNRCGARFSDSYYRDEHKCRNKRKFRCNTCGKTFKLRSSFVAHEKKFGDHKCSTCGTEYKTNEEYSKHSNTCTIK